MDNREALEMLYRGMLGRMPLEKTFEKRLAAIESGQAPFSRVIQEVFERKKAIDHREALEMLYKGMLGRMPEQQTFEKRLAAIESGQVPFSQVVQEVFERKNAMGYAPLQFPPGHFYSPITNPDEVSRHLEKQVSRDQIPGLHIDLDAMLAFWHGLAPFHKEQPFPDERDGGKGYWFTNPAFAHGDGTMLHSIIRHARPKKIVEVGSGYSSLCMLDTLRDHAEASVDVVFVEPFAKLLRDLTAEHEYKNVRIIESFVQDVPMEEFTSLRANDILFIDSTHVLKTGSDVAFELGEILPQVASGVYVHIHDIFWPFEYGRKWTVTNNRSWNEIYGLRYYLSENPNWEIVFFNDYMRRYAQDELDAQAPWFMKNSGGSIWLRRK